MPKIKSYREKKGLNPRVMYLFAAFLIAAFLDFLFTIINMNTIGWAFEANPVAKGFWTAVLAKIIVVWVGYNLWSKFDKWKLPNQFFISGFFIIAIFLQLLGAWSNAINVHEMAGAEVTIIEDGFVEYQKDGQITQIRTDPTIMYLYAALVIFGGWIPLLFGYGNLWLTLWLNKK